MGSGRKPRGRKIRNPRLVAVRTVSAVLDQSLNLAEADRSATLPDARDRALARHLSYGVLRWLVALEWLSDRLLSKPLKPRDRDVRRLICMGLFQLWKDGTAEHAAIHETAECARLIGKAWAVGLVNAVLRRFQREKERMLADLSATNQRYAHPDWLLQALKHDWPDHWSEVAEANNAAAPLWLRINRRHRSAAGVEEQLHLAGLTTHRHPFAEDAICVTPARAVEDLPGFSQGALSVQDPAAQLAAGLLDPEPGQRVLDACAAPGGKTGHLLEKYPDIGLVAVELHASRARKIQENIDRLGLADTDRFRLLTADAADTESWWDGVPFDRVLLDAPCTAIGVIRRHPEIKWLRSAQQVTQAVEVQKQLIGRLWPLLKPGGMLVYATCSVLKRENDGVIRDFLAEQGDAQPAALTVDWGAPSEFGRQILPGQHEMDGFFYARLRKSD